MPCQPSDQQLTPSQRRDVATERVLACSTRNVVQRRTQSARGTNARPAFLLLDLRNRCVTARDLNSVANRSAKYRASERRDIGYGTPGGFGFIFTNDAECLRPAVIPPYGHRRSKMYFAFIDCRFDDLRTRSSCNPVSKFALSCCDRRALIFSDSGFVCCFKAAECPLDRGKAFRCHQIGMR
jgi:hypothetical protein